MGLHNSAISCTGATSSGYGIACSVKHVTGPAGDEVVQVYHIPPTALKEKIDHPVLIKRLVHVAYERVSLPAAATVSLSFNFISDDLRLTDKAGGASLYPGVHGIEVWLGHGAPANLTLAVAAEAAGVEA